jgi:hypothetical protein
MESDTLNEIMVNFLKSIDELVYSGNHGGKHSGGRPEWRLFRDRTINNLIDMFPEFYPPGSTYYIIRRRGADYVREGLRLGSYLAHKRGLQDVDPMYAPDPLYLKREMLEEFLDFVVYEVPLIFLKQPEVEEAFCEEGYFSNEHHHKKNAPDISFLFNVLENAPSISELVGASEDAKRSNFIIYKDATQPIFEKNKYRFPKGNIGVAVAILLSGADEALCDDPALNLYTWMQFIVERGVHFLVYFIDLAQRVLSAHTDNVTYTTIMRDLMGAIETKLMDIFNTCVHKRDLYDKKVGYLRGLFRLMDAIGVDYSEYKSYMDDMEDWQAKSIYEDINKRIAKLNEQMIITSPRRLIENIDLTSRDEGTKAAILLERVLPRYANTDILLEDVSDCALDCVSILGKFKNE